MGIQLRQHGKSVAAFTVLVTLGLPYTARADITISTSSTHNIKCSGGVCAPTRKNAVLNVRDLKSLLKSGSVKVTTTGSGVQANDIHISAGLSWSSTGVLSLDAYQNIAVRAPISVGGSGGISLTLEMGPIGTLRFEKKGRIAIKNLSALLSINAAKYVLVNTVAGLATAISQNPYVAVALADNYDASADGTYSKPPISTGFGGWFEGLGNAISNLSIDDSSDSYVALFSGTDTNAIISDVKLPNVSVTATASNSTAAALVGNLSEASVLGSFASGSVSGTYEGDGLVSYSYMGNVIHSSADVVATGGTSASGLVGANLGTIDYCFATGAVSTTSSATEATTGGLVAGNAGDISQSFATGAVSGAGGAIGGLVGVQSSGIDFRGSIENSLATGSVTGGSSAKYVGGLIGEDDDSTGASYAYSTGYVTGGSYTGGFIGYDQSSPSGMTDTYWDTDTSGISNLSQGAGYPSNDPGITGLTTKQLQSGLPSGFDPTVWAETSSINNGLPYLINNPPPQ